MRKPRKLMSLNLDQFCPICYENEGRMRNVFMLEGDSEKWLYCSQHGRVLYEHIGLRRYGYVDIDIDEPGSEVSVFTVGESVVGEAQVS